MAACRAVTRRGAQDPDVAVEVRAEWVADQKADPVVGWIYAWKDSDTTLSATEIGGMATPSKLWWPNCQGWRSATGY